MQLGAHPDVEDRLEDQTLIRSSDGLSRKYIFIFYCLFFFLACEAQAARDCNPLSVLFDRKAAQVLILKYNSYSFLQQQQRQQSTLRHKFVSYIHICTYMYNLYPPATATTC